MATTHLIGSEIIESNTHKYTDYILNNQFPSIYDGFKKIKRRLIWALKDEKDSFSGLKLKSKTGRYHPYSDESIYETAIKMSQPFQTPFLFFNLKGDFGTYSGDDPASARYVKFKISEFTKDMFLRGIDLSSLTFEQSEDLLGYEPSYLIPKLPTTLLFSNVTIGYGFKSLTFGYPIDVICDMVIEFSLYKEKTENSISPSWDFSKFYKSLIPVFPINNKILNPKQIEKEYKKGNYFAPVIIEGDIKILNQNTIMIMNIPYHNSVKNTKAYLINKVLKDKTSKLSNNITSLDFLADDEINAKILIRFKKNANIFNMIEQIKSKIKFRSIINPFPNYIKNGKIVKANQLQLLEEWYNKRYYSIFAKKRKQLKNLLKRKNQLAALLIVTENSDRIIEVIKNYDEEECIKTLMNEFDLSFYQSNYIKNSRIGILSKVDKKKISEEYETIKNDIDNLLESFNKIHNEIREDAEYFKKKYKMPKHCSYIPKYIGALIVLNKGICNFESIDELYELISIFKKYKIKIIKYPKNINSIILFKNGKMILKNKDIILSKYKDYEYLAFNANKKYTVATNGIFHLKTEGPCYIEDKDFIFTNSKYVFGLSKHGKIELVDIDDIPTRKANQQGNKTDYIYYWNKLKPDNEYILITYNTKQRYKISFHKITDKTKKVILFVDGITKVLGLFNKEEENIFIQLPNKNILHIDSFDKIKFNKQKKKGKTYISMSISKFEIIK